MPDIIIIGIPLQDIIMGMPMDIIDCIIAMPFSIISMEVPSIGIIFIVMPSLVISMVQRHMDMFGIIIGMPIIGIMPPIIWGIMPPIIWGIMPPIIWGIIWGIMPPIIWGIMPPIIIGFIIGLLFCMGIELFIIIWGIMLVSPG